MGNSSQEQKLVVECGYTTLMRYNPETDQLKIDSREPDFDKYEDLLKNEVRYSSLAKKDPEGAKEMLELNMDLETISKVTKLAKEQIESLKN